MNTATATSAPAPSPRISLHDADRVGVAASVLCAIHCGLAPVLLIFLPTFGKIWAHPASHALVAIFIVPLAIFSIRKGYQKHRRRWVAAVAGIGVFMVLFGAVLPALTEAPTLESLETASTSSAAPAPVEEAEAAATTSDCESCSESECSATSDTGTISDTSETTVATATCVDNCCPSAQISETGEISLHIPPAAIVTTLGGIFLITAHVGNLLGCRKCCDSGACVA